MTQIEMQPSAKIFLTYKNFPYKPWYAIAELVDNSTQSFAEHEDVLLNTMAKTGERFEIRIDHDARKKTLSIWDNAMGMDVDDLRRAVKLAEPPPIRSGRSEFGMGLKTAATWMGDEWQVRTKKLGSTIEYSFIVDIPKIVESGNMVLDVREKEVPDVHKHYTIVEIRKMHQGFRTATEAKIKKYLASMYREDLRKGRVAVYWGTDELQSEEVKPLVTRRDEREKTWRQEVNFTVGSFSVRGFICILDDRGRSKAGFDLLRRGRVIIGRPYGWRPEEIFGEDASNNLVNPDYSPALP
jgi:hypothetical protein